MQQLHGDPRSPIWFIGETSIANRYLLQTLLNRVGWTLADLFIGAVLPPNTSVAFYTKTQAAKDGHIQCGDKWIAREIDEIFCESYQFLVSHAPRVVIVSGELALMALERVTGIGNWRGSELKHDRSYLVPTYSLGSLQTRADWTHIFVQDLRRAKDIYTNGRTPLEDLFIVDPSYYTALRILGKLANETPKRLGVDIETMANHITCIGFAWSAEEAICIPFLDITNGESKWPEEQELHLIQLIRKVLKRNLCCGQNFLYDMQYIIREWGVMPNLAEDTMILWHTCYAGLPKSLAFISSMVLPRYTYWKDERDHSNNLTYWTYNCKDCARTLELVPLLIDLVEQLDLREQYEEQKACLPIYLKMMLRGVRQDMKRREDMRSATVLQISEEAAILDSYTPALVGDHKLVKGTKSAPWYQSPSQQGKIFYEIFKLPEQTKRRGSTWTRSVDDDALLSLSEHEPLFKPLFQHLLYLRSLRVFYSTFINVRLDWDNRMRCSYSVGGTETYRDSSSTDVFHFGGNLQNIPKGTEK